jgi:hypothetical protein
VEERNPVKADIKMGILEYTSLRSEIFIHEAIINVIIECKLFFNSWSNIPEVFANDCCG